jgi:Na+-transporting NADH:ubiquinone oxidoreductase subunit C
MPKLDRDSLVYTLGFAAAVCLVCAIVVASAAVALRPLQARNQRVDRLTKVLQVAGLMELDERLSPDEVVERFERHIVPRVIVLESGEYDDTVDASTYDQRAAAKDPAQSRAAAANDARVLRVPNYGLVYHVVDGDAVKALILPIQGYGLWSTMYGYIALEQDAETIAGITFYEHGETPGLGGEIENPRWQALWRGRRAFDERGEVKLRVIKGSAGPAQSDPYRVDGLSGATITSRGVSATLAYWLGPDAFGPYLHVYRAKLGERSAS